MGFANKIRGLFGGSPIGASADDPGAEITPSAKTSQPVQETRDNLHEYWRNSEQSPVGYAEADPRRSEYLVGLLRAYVAPDQRILEIGTNAGRNLHYLRQAGFEHLEGVEISPTAVEELRRRFPDLDDVVVHLGPMENFLRDFADDEFDCVYTMAVLEHVHFDSDWVFAEIARIAKTIVTIEEEYRESIRHFPRNYREVFEQLGMKQVFEQPIDETQGLYPGINARVFLRE